ncbi:hypothetical protein L210DRAFT_3567364, partial [Boletus edulis BED1]
MTASLATMPFHQGDVDWVFARAMLLPERPVVTTYHRQQRMLRRSRDIYHDDFALAEHMLLKGTCFSVFDSMVASDRFCI